jgi:hypothetical protein
VLGERNEVLRDELLQYCRQLLHTYGAARAAASSESIFNRVSLETAPTHLVVCRDLEFRTLAIGASPRKACKGGCHLENRALRPCNEWMQTTETESIKFYPRRTKPYLFWA